MVMEERPIRVARVIARLNIGGPARHTILLAAGLDRRRFDTTLVTGRVEAGEGDFSDLAAARGVRPVVIPELRRAIHPGRDLVALGKLVGLFRRLRPEIVHTHTAKAGTLGRIAAALAGVPIRVHTFHGHVLEGYFPPAVTALFLAIERRLARRTDRIVVVSPALRQGLLRMGIGRPERIGVVPLGLELEGLGHLAHDPGPLRRALGVPDGAPLLGSIGRLVPIKDQATLLEGLARLGAGAEAAHLALVGDGPRRGELERRAADLGLAGRVHFLGWRRDLEAILAGLDVVVCSSRNEGTPVALIEAMAAGVPILSTAVGGVPDLVDHGQTGYLVPAGDPAALAEGLRAVLADPAGAARRAAAARPAVLARHGVGTLVARVEALYTTLLQERQQRGAIHK